MGAIRRIAFYLLSPSRRNVGCATVVNDQKENIASDPSRPGGGRSNAERRRFTRRDARGDPRRAERDPCVSPLPKRLRSAARRAPAAVLAGHEGQQGSRLWRAAPQRRAFWPRSTRRHRPRWNAVHGAWKWATRSARRPARHRPQTAPRQTCRPRSSSCSSPGDRSECALLLLILAVAAPPSRSTERIRVRSQPAGALVTATAAPSAWTPHYAAHHLIDRESDTCLSRSEGGFAPRRCALRREPTGPAIGFLFGRATVLPTPTAIGSRRRARIVARPTRTCRRRSPSDLIPAVTTAAHESRQSFAGNLDATSNFS